LNRTRGLRPINIFEALSMDSMLLCDNLSKARLGNLTVGRHFDLPSQQCRTHCCLLTFGAHLQSLSHTTLLYIVFLIHLYPKNITKMVHRKPRLQPKSYKECILI